MSEVTATKADVSEPETLLADVESALALFAEGIAGRYLHIRGSQEFKSNPRLKLSVETTGQNSDTLFLPESLATTNTSAYRVLVMEQIGLRECDTLSFRMQTALAQVPDLKSRHKENPGRWSAHRRLSPVVRLF
jgi:hypothetical protein